MADVQTVIYGVNLPDKLTQLRNQFLPALAANGSQSTAASSAVFFSLVTELATIVEWMIAGDLEDFDDSGRANPVDAFSALLPYEPAFVAALGELQALGVDPTLLQLLREHFDSRSPIHTVAAVCIAVLYGVQAVSATP